MPNIIKRVYDKGKEYVNRGTTKGKDYARSAAKPLAKAAPVAAGILTGALNFIPVVGWAAAPVAGAIVTNNARILGAMAARGEGMKGREAREEGRDLRKKVGIAAAAGSALGFLANQVVIPAVQASAASSAANAAAASAAKGGLLGPIASAIAPAAAPAAQTGGILSTLGGIGTTLLSAAAPSLGALLKSTPTTVPTSDGFLGDLVEGLLGGGGGGAPGGPVAEPPATSDVVSGSGPVPTWVKVGGAAAAVVVGGVVISKLVKKAA